MSRFDCPTGREKCVKGTGRFQDLVTGSKSKTECEVDTSWTGGDSKLLASDAAGNNRVCEREKVLIRGRDG